MKQTPNIGGKNISQLCLQSGQVWILLVLTVFLFTSGCSAANDSSPELYQNTSEKSEPSERSTILLPEPIHSDKTLDDTLADRRSNRSFENTTPVTLDQLSSILWAAQGITDHEGRRTAPSGLRIYPLTLHVVVTNVQDLKPGVYAYSAPDHSLIHELEKEQKPGVTTALGRNGISAPVTIVMSANYTPYEKFGMDMANQSIYLEAGHVAQNILLQLTAKDLFGVPFTGYNSFAVGEALGLADNQRVVYAVSLGAW